MRRTYAQWQKETVSLRAKYLLEARLFFVQLKARSETVEGCWANVG